MEHDFAKGMESLREMQKVLNRMCIPAGVTAPLEAALQSFRTVEHSVRLGLTQDECNRARQWFDAVQDLHPTYLDSADAALALDLYTAVGMRPSQRTKDLAAVRNLQPGAHAIPTIRGQDRKSVRKSPASEKLGEAAAVTDLIPEAVERALAPYIARIHNLEAVVAELHRKST